MKYTPTGDRFEFHIGLGSIPRNLPGADIIPNQEALGPPIVDLDNTNTDPKSKQTKIPDEGKLAKMIWRNARDRIRGIFDIEGVKPYEVMDSLFNQIELDLGKSGALRSPYPDSWLGTDIVTRLRTDPTYLGRPIDRKYYTEKLVEYVDALKSKYLNNWRIPTTLLSTFENAEVTYTKDPDILKKAFLERLSRDEDRPSLITTSYILRPYQITISIMRAALQIDEDTRLQYAADKIDDKMREDIQRHLRSGSALPILPEGHPQREAMNQLKGANSILTPVEEPDELIIPELGEIEELVFTNPSYEWGPVQAWYRTTKTTNEGQYSVVTTTGEKAQYKMHISIEPGQYNSGNSDAASIVSAFLIANKIHHKMGGPSHSHYSDRGDEQFGKMFTVYAKTKQDFLDVMKGMRILSKRYAINGIKPEDWLATHNMRFEKVIRDTNNTLYYTLERVNDEYIGPPKFTYDKRLDYLLKFKGQGPLDEYAEWGRP